MRSSLPTVLIALIAPMAQAIAPPAPFISEFKVSADNTVVVTDFQTVYSRLAGQSQWTAALHPRYSTNLPSKAHQPVPSYSCEGSTVYKTGPGKERRAILKVPPTPYCNVVHVGKTLLVAGEGGAFRSPDEGKTFQRIPNSGPYHGWELNFMQVGENIATAWARAPGQTAMKPLLSLDAGSTWRLLNIPHLGGAHISPANGKLFAMTTKAVMRSDDLGETWVADDKGIPVKCRNFRVVAGPDGTFYAWSQEAVFFRPTGTKRWSRLALPKSIGLDKNAC